MTLKPRDPATQEPVLTTRQRIIGLDGARGVAAVGVAIMHVGGNFSPTAAAQTKVALLGMGLIFFFVLSGFLLYLPYVRRLTEDASVATPPSARNYAIHRVLRVMPAYVVIFLLVNYVFQAAYVHNPFTQQLGTDNGTGMITDPGQLIANLTLTQTYFADYIFTGINPSWSLTLEVVFYASLPLAGVMMFAMRRRTSIRPLKIAMIVPVVFIVMAFVAKLLLPWVSHRFGVTDFMEMQWGSNWVAVYVRSFLVNADTFGFGMLTAVLLVAMEQKRVRERLSRRVQLIAAVLIPVVFVVSIGLVVLQNMFGMSGIAIVSACIIAVIIAPLARGQRSRIGELLEMQPFRFFGLVSLSLYLWHYPTMLMMHRFDLLAGDSLGGMLLNFVTVLAVTLLLSAISYRFVEKPAMDFARRNSYRWR